MKKYKVDKNSTLRFVTLLAVVSVASIGTYLLGFGHAATPYVSSEAESGSLSGGAAEQSSTDASNGNYVSFTTQSSGGSQTPLLGALDSSSSAATLYQAGFREAVIGVDWANIEPSEGVFSASALEAAQSQINTDIAAGISPSLDIGVQYAPSWIFSVGGGTQFIDQYGDTFTGSTSSGNYVPNAITDMNVRTQLGDYLDYLGTHLTGLASVRLGGAAYNEMRFPSGSSGTTGNAFWFYDASSQATLPSNVQGWKPGTGTVTQATTFLNAYNAAMVNYGVWLEETANSSFASTVKLEMLLPGWGERPGEVTSAENNLLNSTPDEINQALDWADLLPKLPADGRVVAYSTYADATQGGGSNPDPAAYMHSILPAGMLQGGESTGNGQTTMAGMDQEFQDAKDWNWYVANWFFNEQSQTLQQIDDAFNAE